MAGRWRSLAWKLGLTNIVLVIFAVLLVITPEYRKDREQLESNLRRELTEAVALGALQLEELDAGALFSNSNPRRNEALERQLQVLELANPALARVYLLGRSADGKLRWLGGRGISDMGKLAPTARTHLEASLDRELPISTGIYEDTAGQWLSAFHPVRDRNGRVVAVLGADFGVSGLKFLERQKLESTLLFGSVAALAAALLGLLIARGVTRPLKLVARSISEIASGNLAISLHTSRRDEIGELAQSFNQMVQRLAAAAEARDRLHQQVLEKQRLEQELKLAAAIQQSFLPVSFPRSARYRTNARTVLAELVGGDFYDFVELPGDRIGIAVGDVAGRGIAAAIYMVRLISDFRAAAARVDSPREVLERLNQQLLTHATRGMFVTMAYLVLDASSGEVRYSSGGHLPALRRRGRTGTVEMLNEDEGLPLGIVSQPGLGERRMRLEARDTLLLVTDGVIEGIDHTCVDLAWSKLEDVLRRSDSNHDQLVDSVFEIAGLTANQALRDDMTVLSLAWTAEDPAPSSS